MGGCKVSRGGEGGGAEEGGEQGVDAAGGGGQEGQGQEEGRAAGANVVTKINFFVVFTQASLQPEGCTIDTVVDTFPANWHPGSIIHPQGMKSTRKT